MNTFNSSHRMPETSSTFQVTENLILASLSPEEHARFEGKLQPVDLPQGQIMYEASVPIDDVYFIDQGMISVVSVMRNGDTIEVGTIGNEGMIGKWIMLGADSVPYRHIVQVAGKARRMSVSDLIAEMSPNRLLTQRLNRFHAAFNTQVMQGMACNGLHSVEQRCCRWLLTTQDRVGSQELNITHEFLAQMLGVRRASVTEVLRPLQSDGLIRASRGKVTILDPKRLADASCECYGVIRNEYERLLG